MEIDPRKSCLREHLSFGLLWCKEEKYEENPVKHVSKTTRVIGGIKYDRTRPNVL